MINTKENKRIARTPIITTSGLSGAKIPVNGTFNKAKPAIIQAKYKNGLRSNTLIVSHSFSGDYLILFTS
jgi:hypothetical protein